MPHTEQERPRGSLLFSVRVLLVLIVLLPPFWVVVALAASGEATDRLVRRWCRRALRWSGCDVALNGGEHLDAGTCALLVANHSSFIDSIVLLASIPARFRFVANHRVATRPFIGLAVRKAGHLFVNRGSAASRVACGRAMTTALRSGSSLMVFPEGTRGAGSLLPFQLGPFRVALAAGRAVVPIAIRGTGEVMPRRYLLLTNAPVSVTALPPVAAHPTETATSLRERVADAITKQLGPTKQPSH